MFNRELSFSNKIFLAILCGIMSIIFGCSSTPKADGSKPNVYYCPNGHIISSENIKTGIRDINKCLKCGAEFPFIKLSRGDGGGDGGGGKYYQKNQQKNYGPASVFQSSTEVEVLEAGGVIFKETEMGFIEIYWRYRGVNVNRDYVRSIWSNRFNYNN